MRFSSKQGHFPNQTHIHNSEPLYHLENSSRIIFFQLIFYFKFKIKKKFKIKLTKFKIKNKINKLFMFRQTLN